MIALGIPSPARAVVVADYQFTSGSAASSASSGLASATNMTFAYGSISSSSSQYFVASTAGIPDSLGLALSGDFYISFTVDPTSQNLDYSSLSFAFGLTNNTSTVNPYTGNWALLTSATGFSDGSQIQAGSFSLPNNSGAGGTFVSPSPDVSLSGVSALQNVSGPIEFRLYYWDNTPTMVSSLVIRFDSVQLNATAVPEPAGIALLALGLGVVALRLRRRVRAS